MVTAECDETILVEETISTMFPAHNSGLGAVQGCGSSRRGGKDKERGNISSKPKIYCSNISFCFCFYSLLAVPSLHIAIGCLSVALIHTHAHTRNIC